MMIDSTPHDSLRRAATAAAIAYLISFAAVAIVEFGIHERLFVTGHPTETVHNILANEGRFHLSIALDLLYCIGTLVVLGAYYVVLERFGRVVALISALARLVFATTWILAIIRLTDVLRMAKGADYLGAFGADRLQAFAQLHLEGRWADYYVGLPFWAISATLLAVLWLKSRYIPKLFALVGVAASAWAIVCAFAYLAAPSFATIVNLWWFDSPMVLFELAVAMWLLIKGLNLPASGAPSSAHGEYVLRDAATHAPRPAVSSAN